MDPSRIRQLFLNLGHAFDHLFMLIFPTVVLAMAPEFGRADTDRRIRRDLPPGRNLDACERARQGRARARREWGVWQLRCRVRCADRGRAGLLDQLARGVLIPGAIAIAVGIAFAIMVAPTPKAAQHSARTDRVAISRNTLLRVFAILTVSTTCGGIIFNATTVSMPKLFDERLVALTQTTLGIGVLVSLIYAFAAIAQLLVGYLIDRHSIRSVFVPVVALQAPLLFVAGSVENYAMLIVALAMMFFIFGQVPINDAMVAAYTDEKWRARAFGVRYVVSFGASACSVPLVAYVYGATGDFKYLFFVLAALACLMLAAAVCLPAQVQKRAAA